MLWVKEVWVSVDYRQQSWRLSSFKFSLEGDVLISASSLLTLVDVSNSRHVFSLLICEVVIFSYFSFIPSTAARLGSLQPARLECLVFNGGHGLSVHRLRVGYGSRSDTSKQSENASIGFCWFFFSGFFEACWSRRTNWLTIEGQRWF